MIKKSILIFVCLIMLSSCQTNALQNENGEIISEKLMYNYKDGVYISHLSHYENSGYASVMKITVKNGIINSVSYDYADSKGRKLSELKDSGSEEVSAAFKAERRQMNTLFLQYQSINSVVLPASSEYSLDYALHARTLVQKCSAGDTSIAVIEKSYSYAVSAVSAFELYDYELKAVISEGTNITVAFRVINAEGEDISSNQEFTDTFRTVSGTEYSSVLSIINTKPESISSVLKDAPENADPVTAVLYEAYNSLSSRILSLHSSRKFSLSPENMF